MAEKLLAITSEYVRTFAALCRIEIGWSAPVREQLKRLGLDMLDVLHVLKDGDIIRSKESGHGTWMVVEGHSCDDVAVRVSLAIEFDAERIRIQKVQLI